VPALHPPQTPDPPKEGVRAWAAHREQRKNTPQGSRPACAHQPRAQRSLAAERARPPPTTYSCPYPCPYCILPCDVPGGRQMTLPPTRSVPSRGSRPHPRGCRRSRGSRSGRPALPGTLQPRHCRSRPPRPPSLPYKVDASRPSLRTNWTRHCRSRRARSPRQVRAEAKWLPRPSPTQARRHVPSALPARGAPPKAARARLRRTHSPGRPLPPLPPRVTASPGAGAPRRACPISTG